MADYLNIAGRVRTTASDGVAMEAQEVKDLNQNKSQQEINSDVQTELGNRYTKEETYNREEIEELVDPTNYVSVVATNLTTDVTDLLPAEGATDTIYRVGNWNDTQYDPTMYALYAWNGTAYVCLAVRSFVGEVYDISVNHPDGQGNPTPYADLAAALGTSGANIPADIRRGGMSIKFIQGTVQSSDNKYVQYRLMSDTFNTTPANWQGVDDSPIIGSENMVKSGGVADIIQPLYKDITKPYDNTVLFDNSYISQGETLYYHFTASSATGAIEFLDENNQRLMRLGGDEGEYEGFVTIPDGFDHARVIYGQIYILMLAKSSINYVLDKEVNDLRNFKDKTDEYLKINKSSVSLSSAHQVIDVNLGKQDNANYTCSELITLQAGDKITLNGIDPSSGTNCFDSPWTIVECDSNGNILGGLIRGKIAQQIEYTANRLQIVMFAIRTVAFVGASVSRSYLSEMIGINSSDIINREKPLLSAIRELDNGYYNSYAEIDGVASLEFVSHTGWYAKKISVQKGDVFYIIGTGGGTPLLWINCTTANVVKAKSIQNEIGDMERVEMVTDGYLVCNFNRNSNYALYKVENINKSSDYTTRLKRYGDDVLNHLFSFGLSGIVHDWGFIGDSLMSGFFDNVNAANYEYSWAQRMCAILGIRGYNFSVGGMTAKWWLYNNDAQSIPTERIWSGAKDHKKQCYIIGLGVNDRAQLVTQAEGYYPIGDVSTDIGTYNPTTDTDTNAATFVGYYAGIIQRVRSIQPNAPIFVCTIPQTGTYFPEYNNSIKALAQEFANIYVIDFAQYANDFEDQEFRKMFFAAGHMNALGYEWCAYVMIQMIDSIMRSNYNAFKDINMLLSD